MQIYPAIDIKNGKAVRLSQGDFNSETVFSDLPFEIAKKWQDNGASFIHVVDLDGAKHGSAFNNETIKEIVKNVSVPIQVGGGIRTIEDIDEKFKIGAERVILGTAAIANEELINEAVQKYGSRIAVGIDAKDGNVAINGWLQLSDTKAVELAKKMLKLGVRTIIYTDISKDGMMSGVNVHSTKEIVDLGLDVIASGGVSSVGDLKKIREINAAGAIIGKALYLGALNLRDVINEFEAVM